MTNEEAIEILKDLWRYEHSEYPEKDIRKTLDMAIKALKQEPCEDSISRKEVLEYMDKMPSKLTLNGRRMIRRRTLEKYISDMQLVTPQPKTGHWIFFKTVFDKYGCTVKCSSCHKRWKTYDEIRWKEENKFCPNCGEKKESEE